MDSHEDVDAYVYDLDGTLVRLAVDWALVREEVAEALRTRGVDPDDADLWGLLELGDSTDNRDAVESVIASHEREGARESTRLPTADRLDHGRPAGVCSLNCEAACHIALETHGLDSLVTAVVGRDSVETEKPDPRPLLRTIELLGADPERTLFVGDSERDEVTAKRAGVPFRYVSEF